MMRKNWFLGIVMGMIMTITGCGPNLEEVKEKVAFALMNDHYHEAMEELLQVSDNKLLANDDLMLLLSMAYYGVTQERSDVLGVQINDMDFTPDLKHVLFTDGDRKRISMYSFPEMKHEKEFVVDVYPYGIDISPDGREFAVATTDPDIYIFDIETGKKSRTLKGHTNWVRSVAYQDKEHLFSGSNDQYVISWSLPDSTMLNRQWIHRKNVKSVRLSDDGQYIVTASNDGYSSVLKSLGPERGKMIRKVNHGPNYVNDAVLSPDSRLLATASGDGEVSLWTMSTGARKKDIILKDPIGALAFSPNGKTLMAGGKTDVYFIDVEKEKFIGIYPVRANVWSVKFLPDGSFAIADQTFFHHGTLLIGQELIDACRELAN